MSIQAQISPLNQNVSSAAVLEVPDKGILTLSESSEVALDINPEAVASYSKSDADLVVQLKNGESIRVANFYAPGQAPSELFLVQEGKLVAVSLPPVAADGVLAASYVAQESVAGFDSLTAAGSAGAGAGATVAGLGMGGMLLAGAAVIGAGVAISNSSGGGGGGGGGGTPPADTTAPAGASGLQVAPDGSKLSGKAEPGATVGVDTNGDGKADASVVVGADGNFQLPLNPPLTNGQTVTVVVTDPSGNSSPAIQTKAPDTTAPAAATNVQVAADGASVSGKGEPGATAGIDTNGDGKPEVSVVIAPDGTFQVPLTPPLTNGQTVTVVVTDPSGNSSTGVQTKAADTSAPAPATEVEVAADGTSVSGRGEPGARVGVDTNGDGQPDVTLVIGADGNFQVPLNPPLTDGQTVTVVITDAAGNSSPGVSVQAPDYPDAPQVNASNGSVLSGTAEPGITLVITDGDGNPIGQTMADASGNWSFTPSTSLADGTVVVVVAENANGHSSPPASTVIDAVAPTAPLVNPSNGALLSGTAEAGAKILLSDGDGNPIGQTIADANGNWSFTPGIALPNGAQVNVVAQDPAGNTSGQSSVSVDAIAPAAPTVNPSNGSSLGGTAEANSKVIITDGSGNPIAQVTADGSGNWSYTPGTPIADGTVIKVLAQDAAGNNSAPATMTVDSSAPAAPVLDPSNGSSISGSAEAGATVTLKDGSGNPIGQVTADGSGHWSFTPASPLPNGTVVVATASDATGNSGTPATTTVDSVAPGAPLISPSNGATVSGTAEAGAKVVLTDGGGNPIGETTADGSGHWSFTPASPLPNGTVVNATATDPAGNTSGPASAIVDAVAPPAPTVNLSNGSSLSGTAEANSKVIITDGSGNPIAEVTANGSGNWTYTPASPIANGTVVNVLAKDAAGNSSAPATVTVDSSAPAAPIINPSNGVVISGSTEAGATVTLTDSSGNPIGQVTANSNGNWSFISASPLPNGTVVIAKATDPTGNTGPQAATTVDIVAPGAPVISPSNGATVSGTAEAGAKVFLTDSGGSPIGETTADGSGNWTITPTNPLPNGTVVYAVAQDPASNIGPPTSITVDALPPAAPVVNPSNGNTVNGTAEANSTITLKDGSGNPIGQVQADAGGNWSFSPGAQLPNGTVVNVTATDAAGNTGAPGSTTIDTSLPSIPHVDPSNGVFLSGTADAGNTIILAQSNGTPIGQVTVDGSGNWSFILGAPLPDGTVVTVIARNPTGTDSAAAVATIDSVAPGAPVIAASNGAEISGSAEAGATIILSDGGGNPIGQTSANGSGHWSFTPGSPLPNGTVVNAVAKDAAGNTSGPASTTVDALAPSVPVINASAGVVITGTAEIGAKVILTDGSGNPIGETTADGSGIWSFTPGSPLANGTVVNAVARDAAGNTSGSISTTVDSVAPAAPVINPVNGTLVTGTSEAGAIITFTYSSGQPMGGTIADANGNWSFLPGIGSLPHGQVFTAVAKDAAGNTSAPATATVDAMPPAAPIVNPTNGSVLAGTAEAGAKVTLTDGSGNPIGQVNADGSGHWSFTPASPLPNGTVVNAVAQDIAGNNSAPGSTTVDSLAPAAPVINASNGAVISGTAEIGAKVILTDGSGNPIGETTANGSGAWSFTPGSPLANGSVVNAVAEDAAGNDSPPASTTVDSVAPAAPVLNISSDGALLSGTAEANSQVRIVINGDSANPITVNVDGSGNFSLPLAPALTAGQPVSAVAVDAAGNLSGPSSVTAPDLAPPTLSVAEAADTWINAAEVADGIQVSVAVRPTLQVGQVITVNFNGQNGYLAQASHTLTAGDITAGTVSVTLNPSGGPFPQGASTITADINGGTASTPVAFTIDTVPPATPVLSLVGNLLTISTDPGTELTVTLTVGGVTGTVIVTADNSGLASLNLLTDLDIDFSWNQLLSAQVSVVGRDPAGNPSNVATLAVGTGIEQPVTIGGFAVDVSLNPLNPRFGFSGNTEVGSSLLIRVITPALDVQLLPILADGSGHFAVNLLSPTILTQLGLNITDILNLGSQISFNVVATDSQGNESAAYGISLLPNGLSSIIGQINVNGTAGDDVMAAVNGSAEHLNGGNGSDLIFNVGAGDHVAAGDGNDTIQITATNFVNIDGGAGFDTLLLANGIDLDYNAVGVGTLSNIERVDLGKGDAGSVLTLTAAEVGLITDANNTLQITGESNDTLNVVGALNTGTTQTINGLVYDVYAFGVNTLLVEENTVQVVV
ncbi:Ig-like domain-containing protein [Pseudomonas rubra]|uniref:Ig-like domain-containing protein n=1 Tax=Pseudomonas rubra TaxID=2942627 RepID=A0ABT5P3G4_9PSED|nr:Ig-like domain-containing protein [Pseudomonas rubra]MDD1012712.1 Ig-like domain-containing protein [Pseudomonas rubra]MDD1041580.1 Ig-like domain-containing protein [Pseudomonas rubra]MDD1155516.1 Ig-like domain-containing protein [Pseudomonas rubra]